MTLTIAEIPLEHLEPHPANRKRFDPVRLQELATSLAGPAGQLTPAIVRPNGPRFQLLAGERRWRASALAQKPTLLCLVRNADDAAALEIIAIENNQRDDVHPLEEADLYAELLKAGYDVARIAEKLHRSKDYVYDRLTLLKLDDPGRELFFSGVITVAHAVLLARLSPEDQARCIGDVDDGSSALLRHDRTLFEAEEDTPPLKAISVRELQAWINDHVRFDPTAEEVQDLFPETADAVTAAVEADLKVIKITFDHYVHPDAKDGERTYGPRSWKPAEPECEHAVLGVVAAGTRRGESFPVCIAKDKCALHWKAELKERKAQAVASAKGESAQSRWEKQQERQRVEQEKQRAEGKRWMEAKPKLLAALAAALKQTPATASSPLGKLLLNGLGRQDKVIAELVPPGKEPADLVRHLAARHLTFHWIEWHIVTQATQTLKSFGIDAAAIVDGTAAPKAKAKGKRRAGDVRRAKAKQKGAAK